MFRLQFLYKISNAQLQRQLRVWPVEARLVTTKLLKTSCVNEIPSACESRTTSNERKPEINVSSLRQSIREQADLVRKLKEKTTTPEAELKIAIHELLRRKQELVDWELEREEKSSKTKPGVNLSVRCQSEINRPCNWILDVEKKLFNLLKFQEFSIDRAKFDILIRRRFIYDQSYGIYGGASGLFDLGPVGCAMKSNLLQLWRRFFVLEDQMLEIDCPALTTQPVFKASGHIDRFRDYLVKDTVTNECFRLDHLIKSNLQELCVKKPENKTLYTEYLNKLDGASKQDLQNIIKEFDMKSPTGNELTEPVDFNLMFDTQIGPSSLLRGFLRPETAQGIFVNFKRLLDYNQGKLPFAAAQIGNAFRNEISPKSGLLRVREFTMAEIEHFFDPNDEIHPKFLDVANTKILLYTANNQMNSHNPKLMTIGEAVRNGWVANETLGYFLARIQQFLLHVGISPNYLRFRQHLPTEMAHYAVDCWDAECLTTHGWIECVGCANRSAYDLQQHSKASGVNLTAERRLSTPVEKIITGLVPTRNFLKTLNSKKSKQIVKIFANLNEQQKETILKELAGNGYFELSLEEGSLVRLEKSSIELKNEPKVVHVEEITPNVIEPSFGVGRILYAILEHNFRKRDGDSNSFFALPASIAAHKCSILPLSNKIEFQPLIKRISSSLIEEDISHKIDDMSGSIGRRYIRSDEIGIPFSITLDFDSLKIPNTVTLRERDSKEQIRLPLSEISQVIRNLSNNKTTWKELCEKYPKFEKQESP